MPCENGKPYHDGTGDDFGCKIRTIQFDPRAMPTRRNTVEPRRPDPAWERGIPTDNRGMPWLDETLSPIGTKKFAERRHEIEAKRRQYAQASQPQE